MKSHVLRLRRHRPRSGCVWDSELLTQTSAPRVVEAPDQCRRG
jgi:hypothetical protein